MKNIILLFLFPSILFTYKTSNQSLFEAVGRNDVETTRYLISQNANIHIKDKNGMSLLHFISDVETADLLIKKGIDINATNNFGSTPLHWAVSQTNYNLVLHLLEYGAEIQAQDLNGNTALHLGSVTTPEMIALLLKGRARIDIENIYKQTPLQYALLNNKNEHVIYLSTSAIKGIQTNQYITPKLLTTFDQRDTNQKLLEVSVHPIIKMIFNNKFEQAEILIDRETNINTILDKDGNTILHWLVLKKNKPLIKKLLQKKADPQLKNKNNQTIFDLIDLTKDNNFKQYMNFLIEDQKKIKK
ncbi:MAG: ankyrin repeat domain-containing protein [Brevinema sp.]